MIKQIETRTIKRSQIHKAPYNPRTITEERRKKLRDSLEEFGLAGDFVWNELTGNLVAGHQRITILDEENAKDYPASETFSLAGDYDVTVKVVNLPLEKEKILNLKLNSEEIGGVWDDGLLNDLFKDIKLNTDLDLRTLIMGAPAEKKSRKKKEKLSVPGEAVYELVIKCNGVDHQRVLFDRFMIEGLDCRSRLVE
jgi:hypothetical protein